MVYLAHGMFWIILGKTIVILSSFLLMLVFARFASKEVFGSYQYILSMLGIASIVSLPGLNTSLVRSIAQGKEGTFALILKKRFKWSLLGTVGFGALALWYFLHSNFLLGGTFIVLGIFFPFFQSYEIFEYFWNGRKNFRKGMFYTIISSVIPVILLIATVMISQNLLIIISVFLLGNSIMRIILTKKTNKKIENSEVDSDSFKLGKSLTIVQGIETVASYIDKIFIWKFLGPVQVAIYAFAQIPIVKIQQFTPIQALSLPKLSEQGLAIEKMAVLKKFAKMFFLTIPISVLFIVLAPYLYKIFFPQYLEAIPYVEVMGILIAIMPFVYITTAMIAQNRRKEISWIQASIFILRVILFFLLIPHYHLWGVIYAIVLTELLKGLVTGYIFIKNK